MQLHNKTGINKTGIKLTLMEKHNLATELLVHLYYHYYQNEIDIKDLNNKILECLEIATDLKNDSD